MKKWLSKITNVMFIISMVCIGLAAVSPFYFYYRYKGYGDYTGLAALGPVGDFVGGTTVTFFTAASVFLLIATNIMQREELKASREEAQITNETMKRQQFETTFFNMLSLHHQIVKDIQISVHDERIHGRAAIVELKEILEDKLGKADYLFQNSQQNENVWGMVDRKKWKKQLFATTNRISEELLNNVYKDFHKVYGNDIEHSMINNSQILKFIVQKLACNEVKKK
ncbi:hypothetical protein AWW69_01130, partial [Bacillus cereus]